MNPWLHYRFNNKTWFWQLYAWTTHQSQYNYLDWIYTKMFEEWLQVLLNRNLTKVCFCAVLIDQYQLKIQTGNRCNCISSHKKNKILLNIFISPPRTIKNKTLKDVRFYHKISIFYLKWNIKCLRSLWRWLLQTDGDP